MTNRAHTLESLAREIPERVSVTTDGCWEWQGTIDKAGYGKFQGVRLPTTLAHRLVYLALVGPIPEGLQLDHLCRNPPCVNPEHLEPVTPRENVMRSTSFSAQNAAKTHCNYGHEYTPENTRVWRGHRACKACNRNRVAEYAARKATA